MGRTDQLRSNLQRIPCSSYVVALASKSTLDAKLHIRFNLLSKKVNEFLCLKSSHKL